MKTYKNLVEEIQRLQRLAMKRRRSEVVRVIADIRKMMTEYDITVDELQKSIRARAPKKKSDGAIKGWPGRKNTAAAKRRAKRKVAPKYRDAQTGATWSGRGLTPKWLAEKEKAGAKREDYLIKAAAKHRAKAKV